MMPGTTKRPAAPVALGVAELEDAEPDSGVVDVGGTTTTEVKVEGLPVAVRMPVSEPERDGAVIVLLE
jgi:hypothetical protein